MALARVPMALILFGLIFIKSTVFPTFMGDMETGFYGENVAIRGSKGFMVQG